jgi:hypothetical protein
MRTSRQQHRPSKTLKLKQRSVLKQFKRKVKVQGSRDLGRREGSIGRSRRTIGTFTKERLSWSHFLKGIQKGA